MEQRSQLAHCWRQSWPSCEPDLADFVIARSSRLGSAAIQLINPKKRKSDGDFCRPNRRSSCIVLAVWAQTTGRPAAAETSRQMPMPPVNGDAGAVNKRFSMTLA